MLSARFARIVSLVLTMWIAVPLLVVGVFIAGRIPGGWWTLAAVFVYALVSIAERVLGFMGRRYPSATTRRLLLVPYLYLFSFCR